MKAIISKQKLSDQVSARLRQDIAEGKYKSGEKIPAEPELMKVYNVGRSSVREAVKSLVNAGILKVQQGSGTFVNETPPEENIAGRLRIADFEEINAVRKLLEEEIVKLAVENHKRDHLDEMANQLALRKQAIADENRQACTNADIAFHTAMANASNNKVLVSLYQSFTHTIRTFFSKREEQGIGHFAMSHHLHENLLRAVKAKKRKQAQEIIRSILANNY